MYSLVVYVPESHLGPVKDALFQAGAGRIGSYDSCAWQVKGEGQFRALPGANPHLGNIGAVEKVPEWRIELVVEEEFLQRTIAALKDAHPYETPAFLVSKLSSF